MTRDRIMPELADIDLKEDAREKLFHRNAVEVIPGLV